MKRSLAFALLILCLCLWVDVAAAAGSLTEAVSQQDRNKAVARRVFDEIFNAGKFQVADEIYARDFVNHGLHRNFDLAEDQAAARWEKTIAPDLKITPNLIVAEGDLVTVVWTARGTNTVAIGHLPATGARIEERGITVWRIVDGKIREEWTSFDLFPIARQVIGQLKWTILGLLGAAVVLTWMVGRFVRRLWRGRVGRVATTCF